MKDIRPLLLLPVPLLALLLPDATWTTSLIMLVPWLALVAFAFRPSEKSARGAMLWAALAGLAYAVYLHWSWSQGAVPQCSTGGCEIAQSSQYAQLFFGIRTALVGIIGYSLVLLSLLLPTAPSRMVGLFLTIFGFGVSLFLTFSSVTVLQTTCQWCLGSASAMTTLFILSVWRAWQFTK